MKKIWFLRLIILALFVAFACTSCGSEEDPCLPDDPQNPQVVIKTSLGDITIELYPRDAPITVGNFLRYIYESFYDSLIFHRVIPDFVIQAGAFDQDMQEKPAYEPIPNEADNGLSNKRGTIAMARTAEIHSATSQFFINVKDNLFLDHRDETPHGYGYAVFGRVVAGMAVVDTISKVETTTKGDYGDIPVQPVFILRLYRER